jgi:hypothetical protein
MVECICEALALARSLFFTIPQKIPGEKGIFSVGVFNRIGSPPTPLRRGAFRLNMMCKNIYIVNSVNV